ncbi:MAG: reductive dehalogenase [Dehalobacter sp. 4CP]|uniref:reductive dehalogenase n=1 Tax=Dehalobacter sp. CP TaxID=2594474 RepID=UPI0013CDB25F|nr:reductive dehalogenase [Dehalobacter sp.]NBJ14342.1 reductive dehalogenase [Dehalobacter sp. 4CP]
MTLVKVDSDGKKLRLSRRSFLKKSIGMGVGAAGAALLGYELPGVNSVANAAGIEQHDTMPMEISSDYKRYNQKNTVFMRAFRGDQIVQADFFKYVGKKTGEIPQEGGEGWGQLEYAMDDAAWSVEDDVNGYHAPGFANLGLYNWEGKVSPNAYKFQTPELASQAVKKAATFFGADLVGIAPYDDRWVYTDVITDPKTATLKPNVFPFEPTNVIVMAFEMNYESFQAAPALLEGASAGNIYSNMGVTAHKVATFLRRLGYRAIPCGNDTALSVPLGVHAGLGELSRIGILITPKYGPRVRLCKIFTNLPLAVDKPITFGVAEFCKTCRKCADACPSQAILHDKEPSFKTITVSTSGGVKKWALNAEKCLSQWAQVGTDCGICVKVCPYNKLDEWHHDFVKLGTKTPARPILRFFDDLFGYGKVSVPDATKNFWNK